MAVIKIACPKCGQKVSGDETFYGRSVNCPICTSKIVFPENPVQPPAEPPGPPASHGTGPVPASPAADPAFETIHPASQPVPEQPAFETIHPANQPPPGPAGVESIQPAGQPVPPAQPPAHNQPPASPSFEETYPQVPSAPDTPPAHENDEVPSPLLGSVALVVGILNTVTACVGGILLAPVAIILGHAALAKAKRSPVKPAPGQSLAMIGVILGYAGLVFTILLLVALLAFKQPFLEMISGAATEA